MKNEQSTAGFRFKLSQSGISGGRIATLEDETLKNKLGTNPPRIISITAIRKIRA